MEQSAFTNRDGFTLIEFLVAIVIMMIGILALLEMVNVAIKVNMENQLRNEAVMVADGVMALEMTKPFALISTNVTPNTSTVNRPINKALKPFTITKTGSSVSSTAKSVDVSVSWSYKNITNSHSIRSLLSAYGQ
ncbi:MAG TPA: prepilin-type cleavage/methylation domain-containing protein [Desulfuromonadales bacterium]|nr:prepilin-type cleavage/methylation domain-containing protein [Desulfuromonadales bacterium]